MKRPFWHNWSIPEKWSDCLSYAMQIKFLAKWLGKVDERVDHLEAGGATVEVDSTVTGAAGTNAKVDNVGTDTNAKLKFTIPRGAKGDNGRDGTDGTDGVTPHFTIGDVITLLPSEQATASITGTDAEPVLNLGIPQGITGQAGQNGTNGTNGTNGEDGFSPIVATESISGGTRVIVTDELGPHQFNVMNGEDGVGISSVVFKETDVYGNNIYTITLTNGNQYDFTAPKGAKGDQGIPGNGEDGVGISSITLDSELPSGNQYLVTLSNGQTYTFIAPKGSKGDTGNTGNTGPQGVGITSITFKEVDASGNNVYTVNLSNNTSYDFTAPKGNTGSAGAVGDDGVGIVSVVYKDTDVSGNYIYTVNLSDNTSYDITCPKGAKGDTGETGADGANGVGVPTGGTAGQVLAKVDGTDYNTEWITPSGGGGGVTQLSGSGTINGSGVSSSVDMRGDITIDNAISSSDNAYVEVNLSSAYSILFYRNSSSGQQLSSPSFNSVAELANIIKGYLFKMDSYNNLIRIPFMGNDLSTDTVGFGFIDVSVTIARITDTSYRLIIGMSGKVVNPTTNKYETLYMSVGGGSSTISATISGFKL